MADILNLTNTEILIPLTIVIFALILVGIVFGIHGIIYNIKLRRYLLKHKPNRWKEINTPEYSLKAFKFKRLKYFFNDVDMEDKTIAMYKSKLRRNIKISLACLCLIFLSFAVFFIAAYIGLI